MDISDKDWLEHFSKVDYIYRTLGNGNGLVQQVHDNRELCDTRHEETGKDRREIWDYIKTHKGKSLILAGGGAGAITGAIEGIRQLWILLHH